MRDLESAFNERSAWPRTSLALLRLPFVFTQDPLLKSTEFVAEAAKMDVEISLEDLETLRLAGLLVPIFRVDDEKVSGREIAMPDSKYDALAIFASAGRLRDPADEGFSRWWPIAPARHTDAGRWWDGYFFSPWQILDIRRAQNDFEWFRHGEPIGEMRARAVEMRRESLALSALAPRHLPDIVGQTSLGAGSSFDRFASAAGEIRDQERLALASVGPDSLRDRADYLLSSAHVNDPMIEWWPLIRHSDHTGWSKLKGRPLFCFKQRLAAEILLRAHESLADEGLLTPLPKMSQSRTWRPIYDRITALDGSADGLDRALGTFGLSPHPRVILAIEGETEHIHLSKLLPLFGIGSTNQVRLLNLQTSNRSPRDIARYAITPRLGPRRFNHQYLEATPTALFIAMDPENAWETEQHRNIELRRLQDALRSDVELQGGRITQEELDVLVHVFVWGEQKYELANFTNAELVPAITQIALTNGALTIATPDWLAAVEAHLVYARSKRLDIGIVFRRLQLPEQKTQLATILLPTLIAAAESGRRIQLVVATGVSSVVESS